MHTNLNSCSVLGYRAFKLTSIAVILLGFISIAFKCENKIHILKIHEMHLFTDADIFAAMLLHS